MFAFDKWAEWLKSEAAMRQTAELICRYSDNRNNPEMVSNPSFAMEMETAERLGSLQFWKQGTCDYAVFDIASGDQVASEAGLAASNQTVETIFVRFGSLFDDKRA